MIRSLKITSIKFTLAHTSVHSQIPAFLKVVPLHFNGRKLSLSQILGGHSKVGFVATDALAKVTTRTATTTARCSFVAANMFLIKVLLLDGCQKLFQSVISFERCLSKNGLKCYYVMLPNSTVTAL